MSKKAKAITIIGCVLLLAGAITAFIGLVGANFDVAGFFIHDHGEYTESSLSADGCASLTIVGMTGDIELGVSPDENFHFEYWSGDYELAQDEGGARLVSIESDKAWYRRIGINDGEKKAAVLVPKGFSGSLSVRLSTGDVNAAGLAVSNGVSIKTTTGRVDCRELHAAELSVECTTGGIKLVGVTCGGAAARSSTGDISLVGLDCPKIELRTSTGDISGSLTRPQSEYSVTSSTSTGKNNLPESWRGGAGSLEASTSTGNIELSFGE